jgi:putative DNA primase/helicase
MSTARELARTLGGRKTGAGYVARCPAHDDHNPSLSFRDGERGVLLLKCFAGCDRRDVLAALRRRGLLDERPATPARKESHAVTLPQSERARSSSALSLWHESVPIRDTLAWRYLARRGIDVSELPTGISDALRFHPSCPFGKETRQRCMVGLFTDAITAQPRAIHRTALTSSGDKLDRRMLGPAAGCVIRLWPDEDVHTGLVIGEGIETALAAATNIAYRGTTLRPIKLDTWRGNDGADRYGLSVACFKLEPTHQIGRNRPKRTDATADAKPRSPRPEAKTAVNEFYNDEIPF